MRSSSSASTSSITSLTRAVRGNLRGEVMSLPYVSLGFQPGGLDVEQLDVGRGHDEALDRREHVSHLCLAAPDHSHADRGALPLVLMIDFRDRNRKAVAQPVDDRTDRGALRFERATLRNVKIEACGSCVHGSLSRSDIRAPKAAPSLTAAT